MLKGWLFSQNFNKSYFGVIFYFIFVMDVIFSKCKSLQESLQLTCSEPYVVYTYMLDRKTERELDISDFLKVLMQDKKQSSLGFSFTSKERLLNPSTYFESL